MELKNTRLIVSFFISCLIHLTFFLNFKFIFRHQPIIVTFPVELITLPSFEKPSIEIKKDSVVHKKEEIVIPKKKKTVPQPQKVVEQQKPEPKKDEQQISSAQTVSPSLSLEVTKFPYTYYIRQIRKKVEENWLWAQNNPGEFRTVVYFKILRSGEVKEIKIKETSKNTFYDNLCLRAIELANPFPPLPQGYEEDYLGVYFEFKYKE